MTTNSLATIGALLAGTPAKPVGSAAAGAPSTLYDLQYRVVVNALAFGLHSKEWVGGRRIRRAELKLLQFVAIRPWLLPVLRRWSQSAKNQQSALEYSQRLRRAFLGDTMQDAVVDLLVAHHTLAHSKAHLTVGSKYSMLEVWCTAAKKTSWFKAEREALEAIRGVKITNRMLEGL